MVETNIHYPTESSLIVDGVRKTIELCVKLSDVYDIVGWRQHEHLLKKVKQTARHVARIGARKGAKYKQRLAGQYDKLLRRAEAILRRATETCETLQSDYDLDIVSITQIAEITVFIERTRQVCGTARRRVLEGETVPNEDKLFSIFERHPGVESAIGALQSGNGLVRCRDESEVGFERYFALAVLGRNIHALGKLLIAKEDESVPAAISKRAAA